MSLARLLSANSLDLHSGALYPTETIQISDGDNGNYAHQLKVSTHAGLEFNQMNVGVDPVTSTQLMALDNDGNLTVKGTVNGA